MAIHKEQALLGATLASGVQSLPSLFTSSFLLITDLNTLKASGQFSMLIAAIFSSLSEQIIQLNQVLETPPSNPIVILCHYNKILEAV